MPANRACAIYVTRLPGGQARCAKSAMCSSNSHAFLIVSHCKKEDPCRHSDSLRGNPALRLKDASFLFFGLLLRCWRGAAGFTVVTGALALLRGVRSAWL